MTMPAAARPTNSVAATHPASNARTHARAPATYTAPRGNCSVHYSNVAATYEHVQVNSTQSNNSHCCLGLHENEWMPSEPNLLQNITGNKIGVEWD